ncbi:13969_t:CDS:2 [Cetraspora pellucida]|uniref:ATP-dependent DNA helicase n=1 Tax=Cetraspora pellucida TaxID=1433469 RepID=A0A9N9CHY5_9GLOM|nr:13969_t:CDS:2 [Cetraspora pellucida]
MFLLLGERIVNSSIQVQYLTTDPPSTRSKAIIPLYMLDSLEDDPYWNDKIEKYFVQPPNPIFDNIRYKTYFETYKLKSTHPNTSNKTVYQDNLGNFFVKRNNQILTRMRSLQIEHGELFFYQQLLLKFSCRFETEMLSGYRNYKDHFLARFPTIYQSIQEQNQEFTLRQTSHALDQFNILIETITSSLNSILTTDILNIIKIQLDSIKILPRVVNTNSTINLPPSSASTEKSYMIHLLLEDFQRTNRNYLLLAPTGIAAQNISGSTIHSALQIIHDKYGFQTLAFHDRELNNSLLQINTLIIDEISMVSGQFLTYISELFESLHKNNNPFRGINVILVGDLAQLPSVTGSPIYQSPIWKIFYPLFLHEPQRQNQDTQFYNLLQKIRMGKINDTTWQILSQKNHETIRSSELDTTLNTTHIVGYRKNADLINRLICTMIPTQENKFMISNSIDVFNNRICNDKSIFREFKNKTNLPETIRIQPGARVMFLTNSQHQHRIANGTIGIITDLDPQLNLVYVSFCIEGAIINTSFTKFTSNFDINGIPASRTQFPIQNAYALTVHKTQGLTLPDVSLNLDKQIFAPGQAYVALSRCTNWNNLKIQSLDSTAFITDQSMIREYRRLELEALESLPLNRPA